MGRITDHAVIVACQQTVELMDRSADAEEIHEAIARISATPAASRSGQRAKAQLLRRLDDNCDVLTTSLVDDLLRTSAQA